MFKDLALKARNGQSLNGPPDDRQLQLINAMQPMGYEPFVADELWCQTGVVADNLINRSYGKWSVSALEQMADLIVGVPATINHDWDEVRVVWGRTFEAFVVRHPASDVPDKLLRKAGNYDYNKEIVNKEGLVRCYATAFTPIDSPIRSMIRNVQAGEISTGGFNFTDFLCPLCNVGFGKNNCKHYPPNSWMGRNPDDNYEAPYYIRHNLIDIMEWSLVPMPNLPGAGVV